MSEQNTADLTAQSEKLTPQQEKQWEDTMSMMMWTCPGFRHLFYKLLNAQNNTSAPHAAVISHDVPIAATDAKNIMINPDGFFKLELRERTFVMAHEVVHNVFGDVELLHRCAALGKVPMNDGTFKPFNNDTMQKAMDARINALLKESRIGKPPKDGFYDEEIMGADSVLDVYGKYYEDAPDTGGNNPGGFDQLLAPGSITGQNPTQASNARNQQQWAVEVMVAQTLEQAKSQGKMALGLKRLFQDILEPEVPWIDHIETLINRASGGGGYDWTQPNIWLGGTDKGDQYFAPRETGHGAGWIVCWGDTSGSMGDGEIARNMAELAGILEAVNPQRLTVLWGDAAVHHIDEIEDPVDIAHIKARGVGGGGGTDYAPVLDWIRDQPDKPDLFIGFTDGYVTFPAQEHEFPTIWASSTDHAYPFGQVVRINSIVKA